MLRSEALESPRGPGSLTRGRSVICLTTIECRLHAQSQGKQVDVAPALTDPRLGARSVHEQVSHRAEDRGMWPI